MLSERAPHCMTLPGLLGYQCERSGLDEPRRTIVSSTAGIQGGIAQRLGHMREREFKRRY